MSFSFNLFFPDKDISLQSICPDEIIPDFTLIPAKIFHPEKMPDEIIPDFTLFLVSCTLGRSIPRILFL
jgi:hypothetical protein